MKRRVWRRWCAWWGRAVAAAGGGEEKEGTGMWTKAWVTVLHASKAARRRLRVEGDTMCVI